ncbi:HAD family hydrolase [Litoribrevibacter albus]|uniref:Haloacid dehalogenase n=1 Tax=Litoribrevibacter albus TaxID=1473156 RepID=A0AA37SDL4_9GAMM|nr:HAD family hydrolase [Litoribrevibacter albus]GLQ33050.1 haloacid dehalogenase [Litoribrevibacter albus]
MIQLITFDLDNTLWDSDPVILSAEQACWDFLCNHYPKIEDQFTKLSLRKLKFELADEIPALAHRVSEIRRFCLEKALERVGYDINQAQQGSQLAFQCFLEERQNVALYADALPTLNELAGHYRLAALTNGNADLNKLGLEMFEFGLNAEHFDAAKPEPFIFEAALARTKLSPQQVLHIGDHQEHDVLGAARLNIHTLWFNQHNEAWQRDDCQPDLVATTLSEIPELVKTFQLGLG